MGTSKLYDRKCYGYIHEMDGKLIIDKVTAENVRMIFDLYLSGKSVIGIVSELERLKIKSSTGKDKWCKRTIDVMLSNEKYTDNVRLLKKGEFKAHYLSENNNPAIVSKETFEAVQIEKARRSNVIKGAGGTQRKSKKYSSKSKKVTILSSKQLTCRALHDTLTISCRALREICDKDQIIIK